MNQLSQGGEKLGLKLGLTVTSFDYGSTHSLARERVALAQEVMEINGVKTSTGRLPNLQFYKIQSVTQIIQSVTQIIQCYWKHLHFQP